VLVVVDPADYPQVLAALDAPGGASAAFRFDLARKAFGHTAAYDAAIAGTLGTIESRGGDFVRPAPGADVLPPRFVLDLPKVRDLRYGENPHQKAAWYANGGEGFGAVQILQGKELSFTNLLDLDSAARIVLEFSEPAATVIKHTNPCGAATGTVRRRRLRPRARGRSARRLRRHRRVEPPDRRGDGAGHHVHVHRGRHRAQRPRGCAAHPGEEGQHARGRGGLRGPGGGLLRPNCGPFSGPCSCSSATWLPKAITRGPEPIRASLRVVTKRQPTEDEWRALRFAWRISAHVKSNAVIFTSDRQTLAIGAGQMSRVDAVKTAVLKARASAPDRNLLSGSAVASDAFFPFRDGLDAVVSAGATSVVQPGGSMRDAEVIAAADEHGIAMVFTGRGTSGTDAHHLRPRAGC
jgi:phosphoribosylaminoimidazolecarboxamide formyltransferase/IMP cyclohydrolase